MFDRFFPDRYVASTYVIDFDRLYEEGYRGIIFDIDNTLVPHGAPALYSNFMLNLKRGELPALL